MYVREKKGWVLNVSLSLCENEIAVGLTFV